MFLIRYIIIFYLAFLSLSLSAQEPCYGKAIMPDIIKTQSDSFPVYLGKYEKQNFIQIVEVETEPSRIGWEEKVNENCLSKNPEDCLMMCTVLIPAKTQKYPIVIDTSSTSDYLWKVFTSQTLVKEGGEEEYLAVICPNKIDKTFVSQLSNQLRDKGFYRGENHEIISVELKKALESYQINEGFPMGQLDFVTLASLGFGYVK